MLSVAVVEDDEQEAEQIAGLLRRWEEETGEKLTFELFATADKFLMNYRPRDLVLMDIMLKGSMNGLEAAHKMRDNDGQTKLIFTTSMAQFAINGYEVQAMDYFVKPVKYQSLKMRLDQISAEHRKSSGECVSIVYNGVMARVNIGDIYYVESNGHKLIYHTRKGEYFTVRGGSLGDLEKKFRPFGFARCSASYLVNLREISRIAKNIITIGGDEIICTRGHRKEFMEIVSDYFKNCDNPGEA